MHITSENLVNFLIVYINLWSPILVLLVGLFSWSAYRRGGGQVVTEKMLSWYSFFCIGLLSLQSFTMDIFYPEQLAKEAGLAASAFQYDIGTGDLVFVILGLVGAISKNYGFRTATIIGYTIWLWSESLKHIYLVNVLNTNTAFFNGPTAYIDVGLPILGIILLLASRKQTLGQRLRMLVRRLF
jgi:hypothetical protein